LQDFIKRLPNALGRLRSPREPGALSKIFLEENFRRVLARLFQRAKMLQTETYPVAVSPNRCRFLLHLHGHLTQNRGNFHKVAAMVVYGIWGRKDGG
jgi:hypothetical protein